MNTIPLPVTETLNKLPEVTWDRFAGDGVENVSVFGWIERDDGRSDFAFVMIDKDGHTGCRRVEDHFPGVKSVKLLTPKLLECPFCGRARAVSFQDIRAGKCPRLFAMRDPDAHRDCDRARKLRDQSSATPIPTKA